MADCFGLAWQNGIEVSNAVSNVALKGGKIVAYGHNFVEPGQLQHLIKEPMLIWSEQSRLRRLNLT